MFVDMNIQVVLMKMGNIKTTLSVIRYLLKLKAVLSKDILVWERQKKYIYMLVLNVEQ